MIFIGVDFGSCALKAAAIKALRPGFTVLQTHFFPIKPDDSAEKKELAYLSHLKQLQSLYKNTEARYIFNCPQNEVSTHILYFPFKERYKILKSLPFEMEERLTLFNKEPLISDIKILNTSSKKTKVLVFSSFKKKIQNMIEFTKPLGISPFIVSSEAVALANLFEKPTTPEKSEGQKEGEIYIKIGHSHTVVLAFLNGFMQDVYSFAWGSVACIRKIALKYEIPFASAMNQFCEKAFILSQSKGSTGRQIEFSKTLEEPFSVLAHKIQLLLLKMAGEKKYTCRKIFIFGGGAQVRNIQAFLSQKLNLPVARVENPVGSPDWNLRQNDQKQNNLTTALGTAMEGLKTVKNPAINFLKGDLAIKQSPLAFMPVKWRKNISLLTAGFIALSAYAFLRDQQSEQLSGKIHKIFQKQSLKTTRLSPKRITVEKVRDFVDKKKNILKQSEETRQLHKIPSALDKVQAISTSIKKKANWLLDIQNLKIINNQVTVSGQIAKNHLEDLEKQLNSMAIKNTLKKEPIKKEDDDQPETENLSNFHFSFNWPEGKL